MRFLLILVQEAEAVQAEGKDAIDTPGNPVVPTIPPEEYEMGMFS